MKIAYYEKKELTHYDNPGNDLPEEASGLLVSDTEAIHWSEPSNQYGNWENSLFPAFHNGERCWLMSSKWAPSFEYSGSGHHENIIQFEEGVKIFLENGVFDFPEAIV